jgi:alpha-N-arabinofuranosidase
LSDTASPTFRCRRLRHQDYTIGAAMEFAPDAAGECAGLALYASERSHVRLVVTRAGRGLQAQAWHRDREDAAETQLGATAVPGGRFELGIEAAGDRLTFRVSDASRRGMVSFAVGDARLLSDERSWTSNGAWYGCYATGSGRDSTKHADFDWIRYITA